MNEYWELLNSAGAKEYMRQVAPPECPQDGYGSPYEACAAEVVYAVVKWNVGRLKTLSAVSRWTGISVGTLSDIVHGKASEAQLRRAGRMLGILPVQGMKKKRKLLAWQIKHRVEVNPPD